MSYKEIKNVFLALGLVKIVNPTKAKVLLQVLEHIATMPIAAPIAPSTLVTAAPAVVVEEEGGGGGRGGGGGGGEGGGGGRRFAR